MIPELVSLERTRWAGAAGWLAVLACAEPVDSVALVHGLPEDVAWIAVQVEDDAGRVVEGGTSGLARRPETEGALVSLPIALPPSAVRLRVFGYRDDVRAGLDGVDEATLRRHPVRSPGERDPVLAGQTYVGSGNVLGDPIEIAKEQAPIELTADWLPRCASPADLENLQLDAHCLLRACRPELRRSECRVLINARTCTLGELSVELDGRSELHLASGGDALCTETEAQSVRGSTAALSLLCREPGECALDLYAPPHRPQLEASLLSALTVPAQAASRDFDSIGYLSGLTSLAESIAVIGHGDFRSNSTLCDEARADQLLFFDPLSGEPAGSKSLPGCATELIRLSDGGMIVVHGGARPALSRLDAAGNLELFAPIAEPLVLGMRVRGVAELVSQGLLAVLLGTMGRGSLVLTFNPRTLQAALRPWTWPLWSQYGTDRLSNEWMFTVTALEEQRRFVVTADSGDRLLYLDPELPGVVTSTEPIVPIGIEQGSGSFPQLSAIPGSRDLLIASVGEIQGLLRRSTRLDPAIFFEQELQPTAFRILGPGLAIAAFSREKAPFEAWVALVDLKTPKVVPGAILLGPGLVGELVVDSLGGIWATLPSTGTLARIRILDRR